MSKKVIAIGVGAQGSTIADRLNNMPEVTENCLCGLRFKRDRAFGKET